MTKGVFGAVNNHSTVDTCGQRVLGMSGSLMSYINTGNPYDKDYYQNSNSKALSSQVEEKKPVDFGKITSICIILTGIASVAGLALKGKIKPEDITKNAKKIGDSLVQNSKNATKNLDGVKNKLSINFKNKPKAKFELPKISFKKKPKNTVKTSVFGDFFAKFKLKKQEKVKTAKIKNNKVKDFFANLRLKMSKIGKKSSKDSFVYNPKAKVKRSNAFKPFGDFSAKKPSGASDSFTSGTKKSEIKVVQGEIVDFRKPKTAPQPKKKPIIDTEIVVDKQDVEVLNQGSISIVDVQTQKKTTSKPSVGLLEAPKPQYREKYDNEIKLEDVLKRKTEDTGVLTKAQVKVSKDNELMPVEVEFKPASDKKAITRALPEAKKTGEVNNGVIDANKTDIIDELKEILGVDSTRVYSAEEVYDAEEFARLINEGHSPEQAEKMLVERIVSQKPKSDIIETIERKEFTPEEAKKIWAEYREKLGQIDYSDASQEVEKAVSKPKWELFPKRVQQTKGKNYDIIMKAFDNEFKASYGAEYDDLIELLDKLCSSKTKEETIEIVDHCIKRYKALEKIKSHDQAMLDILFNFREFSNLSSNFVKKLQAIDENNLEDLGKILGEKSSAQASEEAFEHALYFAKGIANGKTVDEAMELGNERLNVLDKRRKAQAGLNLNSGFLNRMREGFRFFLTFDDDTPSMMFEKNKNYPGGIKFIK